MDLRCFKNANRVYLQKINAPRSQSTYEHGVSDLLIFDVTRFWVDDALKFRMSKIRPARDRSVSQKEES